MKKYLVTAALALVATVAQAADFGPTDIQRAIETYKQNEIRFGRDFAGKTISFTWTFNRARSRMFSNGYVVEFGNGGFSGGVECDVNDQATIDTIIEWNKGQRVSVTGTIDDVTMGTLQLKGCTIRAL